MAGVLSAWVFADPAPILPRVLPIAVSASPTNNPPFAPGYNQPQLWPVVAAWWQPPDPTPTLSRKLPPAIAAVPANNPVFGLDYTGLQTWTAWVPTDPLPTLPTKLIQPPPRNPRPVAWLPSVLAAWQPPDPQPTLASKLAPSLADVPVNNPPFGAKPQTEAIQTAWQPPPPLPAGQQKLLPSMAAVPVNNPVFGLNYTALQTWTAWVPPDPLPTLGRVKQTPASVDPPPVNRLDPRMQAVSIAWQPPDPLPTLTKKITPLSIDPPRPRAQPMQTWAVWQPPDPLPTLTVKLVQPFIPPSPRYAYTQPWQSAVATAWIPPDPLPTLAGKLNPALLAVRVDNPPTISAVLPSILMSWAPVEPTQIPRARFTAGQPVNNPPPTSPRWLSAVLAHWQLTVDVRLPVLASKVPLAASAVPATPPPVGGSDGNQPALWSILAAWIPPWIPPQFTAPVAASVALPPLPLQRTLTGQEVPRNATDTELDA